METIDWWLVPMKCAECGKEFLRKVKAQTYCDEHRHLAGTRVRPDSAGEKHADKT